METEQRHIIRRLAVNVCRFVLGATFVFSGFVKAVDPLGFFYKIQDYLAAFGMPWVPQILSLLTAIGLSAIEFCVGIFLLVGIRRRLAALLALLMMLVMTPLTLYLALFDPVADCGCFGDAWVLTNWQTFGKNIVLLAMAVVVYRWKADILRFVTPKLAWMVSMYTFLFIFVLAFYCLANLPILDFRPYKIGVNLKQAMEIPEGAKLSVLETYFILEKDGQRQEVTWDNYPDSTWTLVGTRTVELEPGYEPPIKDFNITSLETGENLTDRILSDTGYVFLLVMPRVENADDSHIDLINEIYDYSVENGYAFYALTSSPAEAVEFWSDRTGGEYPFGVVDDITLKTIIRSNPGLLLLKGGTVLNKWSDNRLPDEYVLTDRLENLPLGQQKPVDDRRTVGYVLLWFFVPLSVVIVLDVLVVRRRERKRAQRPGPPQDKNEEGMIH